MVQLGLITGGTGGSGVSKIKQRNLTVTTSREELLGSNSGGGGDGGGDSVGSVNEGKGGIAQLLSRLHALSGTEVPATSAPASRACSREDATEGLLRASHGGGGGGDGFHSLMATLQAPPVSASAPAANASSAKISGGGGGGGGVGGGGGGGGGGGSDGGGGGVRSGSGDVRSGEGLLEGLIREGAIEMLIRASKRTLAAGARSFRWYSPNTRETDVAAAAAHQASMVLQTQLLVAVTACMTTPPNTRVLVLDALMVRDPSTPPLVTTHNTRSKIHSSQFTNLRTHSRARTHACAHT